MICQVGTFDVENYGDLLYPIVFKHMFTSRGGIDEVVKLAFLKGKAPRGAGFEVANISKALSSGRKGSLSIIVGGGDIIRCDWAGMAAHYATQYTNAGNLTFLNKLKTRLRGPRSSSDEFRSKFMSYEAVGPFILDPSKINSVRTLSYCSCGVPFEFHESVKTRVKAAFNAANFIYLRDNQSRKKLLDIGVNKTIHVAPDMVVTLSDFYDKHTEKQKGIEILSSFGVDISKKVLCYQCPKITIAKLKHISDVLQSYGESRGFEVVLLPLGWCHGDEKQLKDILDLSGGKFKYIDVCSIHDIISVISAADLFFGTSLHGNITAFSFEIPHIFAPITGVDKIQGFLEQTNLDNRLQLNSYRNFESVADWAMSVSANEHSLRISHAKERAHAVFDRLYDKST